MANEIPTDPIRIQNAIHAIQSLNPPDLIQVLIKISEEYRVAAVDLREAWQDKEAGKVWDIAAEGLEKTADNIQKYWDTL